MRREIAALWALALTIAGGVACGQASKPAGNELEVPGDDVTLHVRIAGDANAPAVLVALHGGPGNSSGYMVSLEQLAGPQLAVVTYDQRGTGRSSKPSEGYAMANYIADLEAVRQAIGTETIDLLGHSWGGVLALRYAVAYPERVSSIILAGSGVLTPEANQSAQESKAQRILALQEQGIIPQTIQSLADLLPAHFSDPRFVMPSELQGMYLDPVVEQQTWEALQDDDFGAELDALDQSILILWGEDDPFGMAYVEAARRALTIAKLEVVLLDICGHYWHECPDAFVEHVRTFLEIAAAQ
jgi:pimeloyl-ACP methyl ester carboxylesterase